MGQAHWGEDRVVVRDGDGALFSLPTACTDAAAGDPFVVVAAGRCAFTVAGLLGVADVIDRWRSRPASDAAVSENTP